MDIDTLKVDVVNANKELPKQRLVKYSWGNVGAIDREKGIVIIKPVGMPYDDLTVDNVSVLDLDGHVISGSGNPSVDLPIHMELFASFKKMNAVVHTHSTYATMWAQAGLSIPCYGTTHADYFYGDIPITRGLSETEINGDFEKATGRVIVETFLNLDYMATPGVLVASHGVFTWGTNVWDAVHKASVLEEIAKIAFGSFMLNKNIHEVKKCLMDKHFLRKHGKNAYFINDDFGHGLVTNCEGL